MWVLGDEWGLGGSECVKGKRKKAQKLPEKLGVSEIGKNRVKKTERGGGRGEEEERGEMKDI